MSEIKELQAGVKFNHVSIGDLKEFKGKQFLKDANKASSCEVSFGTLNSGEAVPFFHLHKQNEENYIILSGWGVFQVEDEVFKIASGSVVRVGTGANRSMKCDSVEPMVYICIQAKEGSLEHCTFDDGVVTECEAKW